MEQKIPNRPTLRLLGLWTGILAFGFLTPGGGEPPQVKISPRLALPAAEAGRAQAFAAPGRVSHVAAAESMQTPQAPESGESRPASAIPIPPNLPRPRIDITVSPDGGSGLPREWALKEFAGSAKVKVEKVGSHFAVHLMSDKASFSLYKDVTVDVTKYPYLSWAWRVDRLPPSGDARKKETDDQAAQLYVIFPRFPALVRSQIIGYIWDSTAPVGTVLTSPSNPMAKLIVLRSGPDQLGQWVVETRNVLEDYRRLFGGDPPMVGRVSLLINSQHTKSAAESWFAGLVFTQVPLQRETGLSAAAMPIRAEGISGLGRFGRSN